MPQASSPDRPHPPLTLVPNTVSQRLLWAEFASDHPGAGAFRAPAVEVLSLFAERLLETSRLLEGQAAHPVPERFLQLTLWEKAIAEVDDAPRNPSDLASVAREAMEAERLLMHWSSNPRGALDGGGLDLGDAFGRWRLGARKAMKRQGWISAPEQLLLLTERLEQTRNQEAAGEDGFPVRLPARIELRGFPELTRLESRFLAALERLGVDIVDQMSTLAPGALPRPAISRHRYATVEDEWRGAAAWAREQLEQGAGRVAVAAPGLAAISGPLERVFRQECHPESILTGNLSDPSRFHVNGGRSALGHPLVRTALILLELSVAGLRASQPFDTISRFLLAPAWAAARLEQGARARLELSLREAQRARLTLAEVGERARSEACPDLLRLIARLPTAAELSASSSARRFHAWLEHWGWPGPVGNGPEVRHLVEAVRGALEALDFGGVDNDRRALALLRRQLLERRLPAVGGPLSPIQVLDVSDLPGKHFDAVRVIGVHADSWPPPARLNRLLPLAIARELPRSSSTSQRAYSEALQRGVLASSDQVEFSRAVFVDGVPTSPSALLESILDDADMPEAPVAEGAEVPDGANGRREPPGRLARAVWPGLGSESARDRDRLEIIPRAPAPALPADVRRLPRVVKVLDHQSASPWAAFLVHRLGVSFPAQPSAFPGPAELGNLVHDALEALYRPVLGSGSGPGAESIPAAVDEALRRGQSAWKAHPAGTALEAVERQRLDSLLREWLEFESRLAWPNPRELEARREAVFAGFELSVRMDRLDRLDDGALILDYKTGAARTPAWAHDRPTEMQLPLYAVLMADAGASPSGIGLLTVRRHDMKQTLWTGNPNVKAAGLRSGIVTMGEGRAPFASWEDALAHWRRAMVSLLEEFRAGDASCVVHHPRALDYLGLELLLPPGEDAEEAEEAHD
ncbi:MAG: PD-(D/E)XK nuclease family protein [Xanthomonadales bacterium]|nr:PD-(D/E)XK nuclease family protein [Xanthomonadales bacterium]